MLCTRAQVVHPAEYSVNNCHVGDELPIILLQNCVGAQGVDEASGAWDGVNELQMEGSAPSIVFVLSVDVLLLLSEHEPVEAHHNEVAYDRHGVEQVVSRLQVDRSVRGLKTVLSEISCVVGGTDRRHQGNGGQHQSPVGEGNEETIPVHVEEISDVTCQGSSQHQISHSLSCVYFSLRCQFLLCRKILKLSQFIILVWVVFS